MLLTITNRGPNSGVISYLLQKHPDKVQEFDAKVGKGYVFYPKAEPEETTVALILEMNSLDLARGKEGVDRKTVYTLFDYINDRPYVASSFMSTAISKVFNSAMAGKCQSHPELVNTPLDLSVRIYALPVVGKDDLITNLFEPLGYKVSFTKKLIDEKFPEWREAKYVDLTIEGKVTLKNLLNQLYILIPVFDKQKHYFTNKDEIDKLIKHGEGWLKDHPFKNRIIGRYFSKDKALAKKVVEAFRVETIEEDSKENEEKKEAKITLNSRRMKAVKDAILNSKSESVLDLGCGEGRLIKMLVEEPSIKRVVGADVSTEALEKIKDWRFEKLDQEIKNKLEIIHGSLVYQDRRFSGFDVITVTEVIEHLDLEKLPFFEKVVFDIASPKFVIVTTPNFEYNINYDNLPENHLRHRDHRFEWNRAQFKNWANSVAEKYGYTAEFQDIGDVDEKVGSPTQMAIFKRNGEK